MREILYTYETRRKVTQEGKRKRQTDMREQGRDKVKGIRSKESQKNRKNNRITENRDRDKKTEA